MPDDTATDLVMRNDDCTWSGCSLAELARRHGTPLYVVNPAVLRCAYEGMAKAFWTVGLEADIFFSVKTNPLPTVVQTLLDCGAGMEVIGLHELWLAEQLGCSPDAVIVNGATKPPELLRRAVRMGVRLVNVESLHELVLLREIAHDEGRHVRVGVRLNPSFRRWRLDVTLSTASSSSPMGFTLRGDAWQEAVRVIQHDDLLTFGGFHFHLGSGIQHARPYDRALQRVLQAVGPLVAGGLPLPALDVGGGFGQATVKEASAWEVLRLFGWGRGLAPPDRREGALVHAVARHYAARLRAFADDYGVPVPPVMLEPGRALCGGAQMLLLTVQRVAHSGRGPSTAFVDGGAMSLGSLLLAEYHDVVPIRARHGAPPRRYRLVGNLPTPMDVAAPDVMLPELEPGDVVAIKDVGAYFTSLGNTFAGPRPAVVTVEQGRARLVRRRETYADLVARDIPVAHLDGEPAAAIEEAPHEKTCRP